MEETKMGRPTSYRPEYCQKMIEFFNRPLYITKTKQVVQKGVVVEIEYEKANSLPTFEGFARSIESTHVTLINWTKKNPEFFKAYKRCKDIQKEFIVEHGLQDNYNAAFAKFLAVNVTDLRDKTEHEVKDTTIRIEKQDESL